MKNLARKGLNYTQETMPYTGEQTDRQTDRQSRWSQYISTYFVGWGMIKISARCFITAWHSINYSAILTRLEESKVTLISKSKSIIVSWENQIRYVYSGIVFWLMGLWENYCHFKHKKRKSWNLPRSLLCHNNENWVNSLGPFDAKWRQRSRPTLAQVMACCLTTPSHYPDWSSVISSNIQSRAISQKDVSTTNH